MASIPKPAGAIGEWRITDDNESRENMRVPVRIGWNVIINHSYRPTRTVTYTITLNDTVTQMPGVCDPGGLTAAHYNCESRSFSASYGTRLSGVYSETWVYRGSWTTYSDSQ